MTRSSASGLASRLSRENLGVPRKVGAVTLPLFAMFGRAGTALTSTIAFFIILKSYSSLEISLEQVLWTIFFAFVPQFCFALGARPRHATSTFRCCARCTAADLRTAI